MANKRKEQCKYEHRSSRSGNLPRPEPTTEEITLDLLKQVWTQLKHIDSKAQTAVIRVANLQVEVQELRAELRKTRNSTAAAVALLLELIGDKDAKAHAEAVVRDFRYNNPQGPPIK
jgi:hypothetical protein